LVIRTKNEILFLGTKNLFNPKIYSDVHSLFYLIVFQKLNSETSRFKDELWAGIRDLNRKTDLIVLVHNLSHSIPRYSDSNGTQQKPVLSLFLDEAKCLGIPWVLAITNKFAVSAHHQKAAIDAALKAYQVAPSCVEVINSCPYVMPGFAGASLSWESTNAEPDKRVGAQKLLFAPINFVRRPFQKREIVLQVEGVNALCQQIHRVLRSHEESSFQVKILNFMVSYFIYCFFLNFIDSKIVV
jgi:hypothetical protein